MRRLLGPLIVILLVVPCLATAQTTAAPAAASAPAAAPPTPAVALAQAEGLYRAGKFTDAMRGFEQALKLDAKSGGACEGVVRSYLKLDKVQQAWETAQQGIKTAPEQSLTHSAMGEVLFRKGKIEEAQREFITAYNMSERDARAPYGLYRVYRSASYHAQARKMLDTAYAIEPQDRDIQRSWMVYRPRKEKIPALEQELAKETDKKERAGTQKYLEFLKAADKQPHTCQLATKVTETQVPLKVLMPDPQTMEGVELKATINGKAMNLLLDTGASGILIKRGAANGAGLVPAIESKISGVGDEGAIKGYIAYADSIRVGALEFQNCMVGVADTREREILSGMDGLIGADVFSSYLVSIDFPGERLTLKPLPIAPGKDAPDAATLLTATGLSEDDDASSHDRYIAPEMRNYTPFFRFGHYMLIPTKIGNTYPKLFMIDSGAFWSSITPEAAREVTSLGYDLDLQVSGLSGEVKSMAKARRAVLQFGHVKQENLNMWSMDLSGISRSAGVEVSGFLGYTALAFMQMDIDYRDGLVNFSYDPKKYRPLMRWKQQGK